MDNLFSLSEKNILITGATSGIGKSTSILFSKFGAKLIIVGRNKEKLENLLTLLEGNNHSYIVYDFHDLDNLDNLASKVPQVDGIVHSLGIALNQPFKFTNRKDLNEVMDINFFAPFLLTHCLHKLKKINKASSIVFISSVSGYLATATGISAYSASKGAISSSIRVLAQEFSKLKIRVNAICPAMITTEMHQNNSNISLSQYKIDEQNYPLGYGEPIDVAYACVYFISDASKWVTGTNFVIDGGVTTR